MREEAPVYHNESLDFWALSRHADVLAGLRDTERFTNTHGVSVEPSASHPAAHLAMSFLGMDPPRHTQMRALVSRGFTPRRVAALEPRIREMAVTALERMREQGSSEFVADLAGVLPMDVISELLGVPSPDRAELRRQADLLVHREEGVFDVPPGAAVAFGKIWNYFSQRIEERRVAPRDDLISALLAAEIDGQRLTKTDIQSFCNLMIVAGNETTTKLLANALYWLWRNPDQRKLLRDDPGLVPRWVEETLRFDSSTQAIGRVSTRAIELHGVEIPAHKRVLLLLGSGNRDERVFPRAETYDLERDTTAMLSFGQGAHFCLGAALARLEGRTVLEEFWKRFPDYEVVPEGSARIHSVSVRGFAALPLELRHG
ncbi:MAG TPA: cytochrome P450 [Myxococcota bacterium]|nr:cytochrome P450 [Myxococcota bacterium]